MVMIGIAVSNVARRPYAKCRRASGMPASSGSSDDAQTERLSVTAGAIHRR